MRQAKKKFAKLGALAIAAVMVTGVGATSFAFAEAGGSDLHFTTIGGAVEHWGLFVYSTGFVASIPLPTP